MLAEVVLSSSPSSQLAAGFPRCHARPRMRDSNEIMPALVFKYENAHIEFLIVHTIELKLFRDYSKWPGWIYSVPLGARAAASSALRVLGTRIWSAAWRARPRIARAARNPAPRIDRERNGCPPMAAHHGRDPGVQA